MTGTVDLLFFAIQAGIHLARTGRKIYKEDTIQREIVIPLPSGFHSDLDTAREHAERIQTKNPSRFVRVFKETYDDSYDDQNPDRQAEAVQELIQLYLIDLARGLVPKFQKNARELAGLAAVKQWDAAEKPFPHPLQRIAGALVETAVDYFVHVPGGIDEDSRHGKVLKSFIEGLDDLDFQEGRWDSIAIGLFSAALDTLQGHPELLETSDEIGEVIKPIVQGVASDVQKHLENLPAEGDLDAEARIGSVGKVVLRSLLRNTGTTLANNPQILGVKGVAKQAVVKDVGTTLIDILLEDDKPLSETLRNVISTEGMDRLLGSALSAVVQYPDFFKVKNQNVQVWLNRVLTDLHDNHKGGKSFFDSDLYPELAARIIEHGLNDVPKLLGAGKNKSALLVTVAREVYATLYDSSANKWKFALSRDDAVGLFDRVIAAATAHPHKNAPKWLKLGLDVIAGMKEGFLKTLLRNDGLEAVLRPLLTRGILKALENKKVALLVERFGKLKGAIEADGIMDLVSLLQEGRYEDLLSAILKSGILDRLLGEETADVNAAIKKITEVVRELRTGLTLPIPKMVDTLKAA